MSVKRVVTITCDGPCGTAISGGSIPGDWLYLRLHAPHTQVAGSRNDLAHLCPKCADRVCYEVKMLHIAMQSARKEKDEAQP